MHVLYTLWQCKQTMNNHPLVDELPTNHGKFPMANY